jgi:signal transduction histidine kinase
MTSVARDVLTRSVHALLDAVTGVVGAVLLAALLLAGIQRWRRVTAAARTRVLLGVGAWERRRLLAAGIAAVPGPVLASPATGPGAPPDLPGWHEETVADAAARARTWLVTRVGVGLPVGAAVLGLLSLGLALLTFPLYGAGRLVTAGLAHVLAGLLALAIGEGAARALAGWDARTALRLLGPSEPARLAARMRTLVRSRASAVEAIDDERRRIERDLHDGVQQQLVALALLLARAKRTAKADRPAAGDDTPLDAILDQAQENALQALAELRDVAWRVYPAILDDRGLDAALSALAERSAVPVRIDYRLSARLPSAIEPVAYFAVSEAVTNAAKHSSAEVIHVTIRATNPEGDRVLIIVRDDGAGGADPSGAGLSGLLRRVTAVEGVMSVTSPPGGPTILTVELPCAS